MLKKSLIVTIVILILKIIGFIKQMVIAKYFGTSVQLDMYSLVYSFIYQLGSIISEALIVILISQYSLIEEKEGKEGVSNYISGILIGNFVFFIIWVLIIISSTDYVSDFLIGEKKYFDKEILKLFLKIEALNLIFITIANILSSVLEINKKFFLPRVQSLINSITIIFFVWLFSIKLGSFSLVLADLSSIILYLFLISFSIRRIINFKFVNPLNNCYIKSTLLLMIPLIIGSSSYRINRLIDSYLASKFLGGVSTLAYAHVLEELITVTFGVSFVNIMYSYISSYNAKGEKKMVEKFILDTLKWMVIIIIPVSVISVMKSEEIVKIIFMRGNFEINSVRATSKIFQSYALGFYFILFKSIINKILILNNKMKLITAIGLVSLILNIILSVYLSKRMGVYGISSATLVVNFLLFIFLIFYMRQNKYINFFNFKILLFLFKIFFLNVICIFLIKKLKIIHNDSLYFEFINCCIIYSFIYLIGLFALKILNIDKLKIGK